MKRELKISEVQEVNNAQKYNIKRLKRMWLELV